MENEKTLRIIVGNNLVELRKKKGMTQLELANQFGYSDKAISKWEHGDTLPDLETLYQLCLFYEVPLDYLVHEGEERNKVPFSKKDKKTEFNKGVVVSLIIASLWTLTAALYFTLLSLELGNHWLIFPVCLSLSLLTLIIFHNIWWKDSKKTKIAIQIAFIWSIIITVYLLMGAVVPGSNGWYAYGLFVTGIPLTIACVLWNNLKLKQ